MTFIFRLKINTFAKITPLPESDTGIKLRAPLHGRQICEEGNSTFQLIKKSFFELHPINM